MNLRPSDASYGYRHRPEPDRCEGLYASPVAGEGLEVLSLTSGSITGPPTGSGPLFITAPDLQGLGPDAPRQITVVGRALPLRVYYRLDTTLPPNGSQVWPVDQVVIPAGLKPADIGLVGMVKTDEGVIYVPVSVSPLRGSRASNPPEIVFRAPVDIEKFQWRVYSEGQSAPWKTTGAARAGDPITISLDAARPGTTATLEVAAKPAGESYIQSRYRIFRP